MSKDTRNLILEMSVGVIAYNLFLTVLAPVICPRLGTPVMPVVLGLAIGMAADILMLIHMAVITERVLDSRDENYANTTTVVHSILRKVVFVAVAVVLLKTPQVNIVAMIIGAMGLKAGAYLQPFIHKSFGRNKG